MYRRLFNFIFLPLLVLFIAFCLTGCATLQEALMEIPQTDASAEIGAIEVIAGDYLKEPYQTTITIGIGYALALLRRMYKKKKGAKG